MNVLETYSIYFNLRVGLSIFMFLPLVHQFRIITEKVPKNQKNIRSSIIEISVCITNHNLQSKLEYLSLCRNSTIFIGEPKLLT